MADREEMTAEQVARAAHLEKFMAKVCEMAMLENVELAAIAVDRSGVFGSEQVFQLIGGTREPGELSALFSQGMRHTFGAALAHPGVAGLLSVSLILSTITEMGFAPDREKFDRVFSDA